MENKSFDDIIKQKLASHSEDLNAGSWELFQTSEADAAFDEVMSSKLEDFDSNEIPQDFDLLEEKLPSAFDALIGAKLADVSMNDGPDWDQFEKILAEDDVVFDQKVVEKVSGFEAPVGESQWPKLSAHLERVEKRRRRIIITKFIEAAVFILFILTIMQLYPIQKISKKGVFRTHSVVQDLRGDRIERNGKDTKTEDVELRNSQRLVYANETLPAILETVSAANPAESTLEKVSEKIIQDALIK